jgi:O-succinylbenzoate synthase
MLETIVPQAIVIKPGLVGGLQMTEEWIKAAEKIGAYWWITSALESNIGLNAIAQFTATYQTDLPQGLGTGQLYTNNIPSPLSIKRRYLHYLQNEEWKLPPNL